MERGHPDAWHYTVGRIWEEVRIVQARIAAERAETAWMTWLAIASQPNIATKAESTQEQSKTFFATLRRALGV